MTGFWFIVRRDMVMAWRQGGDGVMAIMFFLIIVTLFPLGVGPENAILARIAAAVVWVAALLATLLSLERMFQADFEDGSLDLMAVTSLPLEAVVLAKCMANWLLTGAPLLVAAPVLAIMLHMDREGLVVFVTAMALGTPSLVFIGAIGAALTVGARRGGVLLTLLVLPLYIPVLIFGVDAVETAMTGQSAKPHLLVLGGLLLGTLPLGLWASTAALRQALEYPWIARNYASLCQPQPFLAHRRPGPSLERGAARDPSRPWALSRFAGLPRRLPAGGKRAHYVCACARGLDGPVRL